MSTRRVSYTLRGVLCTAVRVRRATARLGGPQRTPIKRHEGAFSGPLSRGGFLRARGRCAQDHFQPDELGMETATVHAYFVGLEQKHRRQLSSPRKPFGTCGAFGRRPMTEVSVGSWAMAQLLAPIQWDDCASAGCLRASRKSCALTVSAAELPRKAGRLRQPGMSESSPGGRNDSYII